MKRFDNVFIAALWLVFFGFMAGCSDEDSSGNSEDAHDPFGDGGLVFDIVGGGQNDLVINGDSLLSNEDADTGGEIADGETDGAILDVVEPDQDLEDTGVDAAQSGFEYPCEPGAIETCETACGTLGKHKCLKEWGPCIPPDELCDNCEDDNCDGEIDEGCLPNPECNPTVEPACAVPQIEIMPAKSVGTGEVLTLSAKNSSSPAGAIVKWAWTVQGPVGSTSMLMPSADVESPTFLVDVAGQYLFKLQVWDAVGNASCAPSLAVVSGTPVPPVTPAVGCSDGQREGFLDEAAYTHIAGCAGGWEKPGITPDSVVPTCDLKGGDDGPFGDGAGCSAADLCAQGWHICNGWAELALKSPTGCVGATPPDTKPKSLFFALRQDSENGSICGTKGDGFNDVFGCGNLGSGLAPDKNCGPLDRVLASTIPDKCGFNEAEPPLGPWQCIGGPGSDLKEGQTVTKKGCPKLSCTYDGVPLGSADKGGVLCCRD